MKKHLLQIQPEDLPAPFSEYWNSSDRLDRPYTFYLIDGEVYIRDGIDYLLHHWTLDSCAGIGCFRAGIGEFRGRLRIPKRRDLPLIGIDGQFQFEILYTDDYETSIRNQNGKKFVVHSG